LASEGLFLTGKSTLGCSVLAYSINPAGYPKSLRKI
jgi:hypothetical protein